MNADRPSLTEAVETIRGYKEFCHRPENRKCICFPPENYTACLYVVADAYLELQDEAKALLSFLVTAKQENEDDWMDLLAERINAMAAAIGDPDRVRYVGCNVGGYLEVDKLCPSCGGSGAVDSGGFREDGHPISVPCGECS